MGTGTLTDRSTGEVILDTFFNETNSALNGDFVGRNASGIATLGQNLGTNALPWGTIFSTNLVLNGSSVDTSLLTAPKNRIVSGEVRSASNQPQFIDPNGAAASFILRGLTTNLVLDIDGSTVTVNTDITKSSLTVGPSGSATALIDDLLAADQEDTKVYGEYKSVNETITVDTMGAEFQAFIGSWQIVEITGVATEYALVFVKSTTELTNAYRGFFTDSSSNPVNRTGFTNNDTVTVLSTGWVFVENNATTVDVTYTTPVKSFTSPSGPATGDYWYDLSAETWKRYDGATFQIINRTLVGVVGIDATNCVCARSFDFYQKYSDTNNSEFQINSTSIVELKDQNTKVNVYGSEIDFGLNHENWNITTDLAASTDMYNATEQASTEYYAYVKDDGDTALSDISPHYRPDLLGYYHPHNPWRAVAVMFNDGSSNITLVDEMRYNKNINPKVSFFSDEKANSTAGGASSANTIHTRVLNAQSGSLGSLATNQVTLLPGVYNFRGLAPFHTGDRSNLFIYNVTDTTYPIEGQSQSTSSGAANVYATVFGTVTISTTKVFELRHYIQSANATGLGLTAFSGISPQTVERYGFLETEKIG